ncbi:MAG: ATP-binding protein [Sandaracinaceae bacterium]|nr:ATP-binding protein [Sandaracinaceae bacterium]
MRTVAEWALPRRVVVTGGPGGGKTALLEVVQRYFCEHVVVLPGGGLHRVRGGFPRRSSDAARRGAQLAIYHVQDQLERIEVAERRAAVVLCDRGVVDGAAYWPDGSQEYWSAVGEARASALARYAAVIHLRTPALDRGYDHSNPLRTESAIEAARIDERIAALWEGHPRCVVIESADDFVAKLRRALDAIGEHVPSCCRAHVVELAR